MKLLGVVYKQHSYGGGPNNLNSKAEKLSALKYNSKIAEAVSQDETES